MEYAVGDVTCMPDLFDVYAKKLSFGKGSYWEAKLLRMTEERLVEATGPEYDARGPHKALAPSMI